MSKVSIYWLMSCTAALGLLAAMPEALDPQPVRLWLGALLIAQFGCGYFSRR